MSDTSGNSVLLSAVAYRAPQSRSFLSAPSGYTTANSYYSVAVNTNLRVLTKNLTTTDGSFTKGTDGNISVGRGAQIEILAAKPSGFFAMF